MSRQQLTLFMHFLGFTSTRLGLWSVLPKKNSGSSVSRTQDPWITSQTLNHWAMQDHLTWEAIICGCLVRINSFPLSMRNFRLSHLQNICRWPILNWLFTKRQNFRPVPIQRTCRRQNKCKWELKFLLGKVENILGREKMYLQTCKNKGLFGKGFTVPDIDMTPISCCQFIYRLPPLPNLGFLMLFQLLWIWSGTSIICKLTWLY